MKYNFKTYQVYAQATASQWLGEVIAQSKEEALELGQKLCDKKCKIRNYSGDDFHLGDVETVVEIEEV